MASEQTLTLSPNSITAIANGNLDLRPVLQVLDVKEIGAAQTRYRLLLSDGSFVQQGVLASQLNPSARSGHVRKGSILQLLDYVCNTIRGLKIIMVLNMEIISFSADIIGDPKQLLLDKGEATATSNNQSSIRLQQEVNTGPPPADPGTEASGRGGLGMGTSPSKPWQSIAGPHTISPAGNSPYGGRPVVSPSYEPAPNYSNKGPIARNQAPAKILPISALNPYQGRWTIKARVTAKGDLRRFHNARGDGKVFHFDLLDADGGEIRATCFNSVADQFIDRIEVGKVFMISKGSLKPAQRNFNHLRNDWEIFLESSSIVEPWTEEDNSIPQQQFKFTPISEIENMEGNAMVDVIGVVVGVSSMNTILRKNGTETQKRTLQLRDLSGRSIDLTMWGSFCAREGNLLLEMCDSGRSPILAVKAGRISDFSGKSVGTISTTQLLVDPDLPEAQHLNFWFQGEGKKSAYQSISREGGSSVHVEMRKTVAQIKEEGLGRSGRPDWIAVKGTVSFIKTDKFCYTACPLMVGDRQCNRKVLNQSDGMWHCDRCDKSAPECEYRYLLSLQVQDHTGVTWVTAFQEAGEEIMGVSARELFLWKQDEDLRFEDAIQKLLFTQNLFKLKVKEENYNDELGVKCSLVKTDRLVFQAESRVLLDSIGRLMKGDHIDDPGPSYGGMPGYSSPSYLAGQGSSQSYGHFTGTGTAPFRGHTGVSPNKYSEANSIVAGGGGSSMRENSSCFKCGQAGHWAKDCWIQGRGGFR